MASHTQRVPLQTWPVLHVAHAPPPLPQAGSVLPFAHVVELLQHPPEHELAVQTHCPLPLHASPLPHAWQLAPPTPHALLLDAWHWPLASQQPLGHEAASHTHRVPLQCWPPAQTAHVAPPLPHAASVLPAVHVVALLQHPLEHELAVHAHWPLPLHASPGPQAWQLTPPVPQVPLLDVWH